MTSATTAPTATVTTTAIAPASQTQSSQTQSHPRTLDHDESLLATTFSALREGKLDEAQRDIDTLLHAQPDFRLAQLIRGDLLLAHAQALDHIGNTRQDSPALEDLRAEARARLESVLQPPPAGMVPEQVLLLADSIRHIVVVDTEKSRLYLFANRNGMPVYLADFYVTIGRNGSGKSHEGDERTPLGIYRITSRLHDSALLATYGPLAFPLDFPNDWDKHKGSSGHGIWLHGTFSGTYSRPPHASDGCVVLTNTDLDSLANFITPDNTPVLITDHIRWVTPDTVLAERQQLMQHVSQWQQDWQSLNVERYLGNYSKDFTADQTGFADWAARKRQIAPGKRWIKVELSNLSLFEYPGQSGLFLADFRQDYQSNNLVNNMHKRQYWTQQSGEWKILAEDSL